MKIINRAFDYNNLGAEYSSRRQTDPAIASYIFNALGDAKTVLNVGAGSGSYEPTDRFVIAVEPSVTMRAQRLLNHKNPAVIGQADDLPFDDKSFDAATAFLTIHHWADIKKGLKELRRVTRHQIIIMTFDPDALDIFWNAEYFPEVIEVEKQRYPTIQSLVEMPGTKTEVQEIPVSLHCIDGFQEAFYGRPEAFLNKDIRKAMSAWGFISGAHQELMVKRLYDDLQSGEWDRKYGHLRTQPAFSGALRLVISNP
jgi:ubiquinone/menaquinone biosynthesis C-methylase UbiE